ncbi:MAG: hypothetical protein ACRDJU_03715 [Actinomycetota bacterium]
MTQGGGVVSDVPCQLGVWGTFDTGSFADALVLRILRRELRERLPRAEITAASPIGARRLGPRDGGEPLEALGPWRPERVAALSAGLDCVVIASTALFPDPVALEAAYGVDAETLEELSPERYFVEGPGGGCPGIWLAVQLPGDLAPRQSARLRSVTRAPITVTDEASQRRLRAAKVPAEVEIVPDLALLAPRLHSPELLAKRLDYLRLMGWYPTQGAPLVVEAHGGLVPEISALAKSVAALRSERPDQEVVVAETGCPGDLAAAEALVAALGGDTFHLPGTAGLEDLCAAVSACSAFAATTLRGALVAAAHGRPTVLLGWVEGDLADVTELAGEPAAIARTPAHLQGALALALASPAAPGTLGLLHKELDAALDGVAEAVAAVAIRRREPEQLPDAQRIAALEEELANLGTAHDARSRRLASERMIFANHLRQAEEEIAALKAEASRLRSETAQAQQRLSEAESELAAEAGARAAIQAELAGLRATRTFRYTAELRSAYGKLRQMAGTPDSPQQPEQPQHP